MIAASGDYLCFSQVFTPVCVVFIGLFLLSFFRQNRSGLEAA